ncbi:TPA: fimbrial protein [Providencia rettgeri]
MKKLKMGARLKSGTLLLCTFSGLLLVSCYSQAASDSVNFRVKVTIVQKTCDVNGNDPIHVDFGDMIIKNIDGVMYERNIPYTLDCEDASSSQGLKLQISGSGASFNSDLLRTSESNLGLRFKRNNMVFARNTWVNFTYGSPPNLSVVPVVYGQNGLDDGEFIASATFNVEYQ